jgi:hypothetical protein
MATIRSTRTLPRMTPPRLVRRFPLVAIAALCALAALPTAADAQWRTEAVPGDWYLSPLNLDFDARGRGLLSWEGINPTSPHKFTALDVRAPGGGWTQAPNLAGITWGNAQIHLYGSDRALLIAGQVSSLGRFNRARWRLVSAYGRSDGSFGALRTLAEHVSLGTLATAADPRGDALAAWQDDAGVTKLRERPAGGAFGPTRTLRPGGTGAAAMNLRGDRVLAWWSRGGVYARVRRHGEPWGPARLAAKARYITNAHVRAAITAGGRVVLAWESADIGEDRPLVLRAGLAQLVGGRWRAHALERATHATVGLPETSTTQPVVDSAGRVYVAWTGTSGGGLAVKLARVVATGPRAATILSAGVPGAALNDVAAGPGGALLVSWSVQRPSSNVVYASLRRDGGAFAGPQQITPEDVNGFGVSRAAIAPSTGEAVVTWSHSRPDGGHVQASVNAP